MKQLLSIIAHNRPGVLSKITGLISRRGYNIDSLMSGTTEKPGYARLTRSEEHTLNSSHL